ncbi:hypothetical protein STEG23_031533, partial [Scotinomys teguina]
NKMRLEQTLQGFPNLWLPSPLCKVEQHTVMTCTLCVIDALSVILNRLHFGVDDKMMPNWAVQ